MHNIFENRSVKGDGNELLGYQKLRIFNKILVLGVCESFWHVGVMWMEILAFLCTGCGGSKDVCGRYSGFVSQK